MDDLQQDPKQFLQDYLTKKMLEKQDFSELQAEQDAARERSGYIGALEGIGTIAKSIASPGSEPVSYTSAKDASRQQLVDYLAQKKAERDAETDRMAAAKELGDLQTAQAAAAKANKPQLPALSDKVVGAKGEPLYTAPGQGIMTQDPLTGKFTPYAGKPRMFKSEQIDINLGGLAERKKSNIRGQERLDWDKDTKINDRVSKVGKALTAAGAPQYEVYKQDFLNQEGSMGQAYGRLASLPPDWLLTDEGQKFRNATERLIAPIRKDLFGATLAGGEADSFNRMMSTGKGQSMAAFKHSLDKLLEAKDKQIEGIKNYDEDAYSIYEERSQKSAAPAPSGTPSPVIKYKMQNGQLVPVK